MNRMTRAALGVLCAIPLTLLGGLTANATAEEPPPPNCWLEVDTGESLCVDADQDLAAAVAETGVQLVVPDGTVIGGHQVDDTASARGSNAVLASTVISILYDNIDYDGSSYVMSVSSGTCATSAWGYTDLAVIGWGDRASSFKSYAGCVTAVFEHENYGGAQYGYYVNGSSFGSMNDRASSWRVH